MGGHIYLNTGIYEHPTLIQIGPTPFVLWVRALCHMNRTTRNGRVAKDWVKSTLREMRTNAATVNTLERYGLLLDQGDEYAIAERAGISSLVLWKLGPSGQRRPGISPAVRQRVYARDGFACVHCGSEDQLSIDHIIPWSKGGAHSEGNFQTLCMPCNIKKGTS
jgi:hypothetical protein